MQPDRFAVAGIEHERALVERAEAELVEQRQQVGERHRRAAVVHAEPPLVGRRLDVVEHRRRHPIGRGAPAGTRLRRSTIGRSLAALDGRFSSSYPAGTAARNRSSSSVAVASPTTSASSDSVDASHSSVASPTASLVPMADPPLRPATLADGRTLPGGASGAGRTGIVAP